MLDLEKWEPVQDFSSYRISDKGEIYNLKLGRLMATSHTNFGHLKITLVSDWDAQRYTRSVAQLVAEAFVEAPNELCDTVVVLDGDLGNVCSDNLVWRPRWFAWKYTRQLKIQQPIYYRNLHVLNLVTNVEYENIVEAGMTEGLLFEDIWRSTYRGESIFPTRSVFEVIERV